MLNTVPCEYPYNNLVLPVPDGKGVYIAFGQRTGRNARKLLQLHGLGIRVSGARSQVL